MGLFDCSLKFFSPALPALIQMPIRSRAPKDDHTHRALASPWLPLIPLVKKCQVGSPTLDDVDAVVVRISCVYFSLSGPTSTANGGCMAPRAALPSTPHIWDRDRASCNASCKAVVIPMPAAGAQGRNLCVHRGPQGAHRLRAQWESQPCPECNRRSTSFPRSSS